jgi:hypothetical protein
MELQRSIKIYAPVENIWESLVDPSNVLKWCTLVNIFRSTSIQTRGAGATFYFEERAVGHLMKLNFIVSEWVEKKKVAYKMVSGNFVRGYEQCYTLESQGHCTKVSCFENVELPYGIFGRLAGFIRKPRSEAHLENMLRSLKIICENPSMFEKN